jgi:hypothetical protein
MHVIRGEEPESEEPGFSLTRELERVRDARGG